MKHRDSEDAGADAEDLLERLQDRYHDRPSLPAIYNQLTSAVIGAAMHVHSTLGPGFLESFYERAMGVELAHRGIAFRTQVPVAVFHRDVSIGDSFLDLLIDEILVVELKAVEAIAPIHRVQTLSYLRAGNFALGLIINFNVLRLRDGIARVIDSRAANPR